MLRKPQPTPKNKGKQGWCVCGSEDCIVTPLANLLEYRKLRVISVFLEVFENKCYSVIWQLANVLQGIWYAARTLVALVI